MPVREIMTAYVVTTREDVSIVAAATRMVAQNISCLIVIDDAQQPIGIITERDFVTKVPMDSSALGLRVRDVMTRKAVTIRPEETVECAFRLLAEHHIRKIVVVGADGKLAGVVTQTDLVKLALKLFTHFAGERLLVKDWMTKKVITIPTNASFALAKQKMKAADIGAMALTAKGAYVGIFTEFDVVAQFYDQDGILSIKSPREIMRPHLKCVSADTPVFLANRIMLEMKVRRLLALDGPQVAGIITQTDIAHAIFSLSLSMRAEEPKLCAPVERAAPITSEFVTEHLKRFFV